MGLSRREFLGTALGGGAAGLLAPYVVPSGVLAAAGRPGANERIGVGHIGNIARWLGRKLQWDPDKEVLAGDDEANQMLRRPMRPPWRL